MKKEKSDQNAVAELTREWLYKENNWLWEENRDLVKKIEKLLWEKIKLEEEIRSLEWEKRNWEVESEELKMWLREKLPLALLKEYMEKFEWVDLKNV